jgi:peptide methionine sulfoxide reductase msrA/msrB
MLLKTASLSPDVLHIVQDKGTERPFSGAYNEQEQPGTYLCRQCGLALFRASTKFHAACGWPSFDEEINGAVKRMMHTLDPRTEILCGRCDAHLGHVFKGEQYTKKNLRHCVNSASIDFVVDANVMDTEEAIVAEGCFWGVEYYFKHLPGVLKTQVGYSGGNKGNPTYKEVCTGSTGHVEAIRVVYDPQQVSFEKLMKYFFEIHDPTQIDGQGPDIGGQYLSVVFYYNESQKNIATSVIDEFEKKYAKVATQLRPVDVFWPAEEYHQDYYTKMDKQPYCHRYTPRF